MNSIAERLRGAASGAHESRMLDLRDTLDGIADEVQRLESRRPDPPLHSFERIGPGVDRMRVAGGWVYAVKRGKDGLALAYVPDPRP